MKTYKQLIESKNDYLGTYDETKDLQPGNQLHHGNKLHDAVPLYPKEIEELKNYSVSNYDDINAYHRLGSVGSEGFKANNPDAHDRRVKDAIESTKHIDSAIDKHTTNHPIHVWRGLDSRHSMEDFKSGNIFHDKGYVSTSVNPQTAHKFIGTANGRHIAHIKIPAGSKALYLNQQKASDNSSEHEVLLPRNSKFKYISSHQHHETTIHHLEHIPEES